MNSSRAPISRKKAAAARDCAADETGAALKQIAASLRQIARVLEKEIGAPSAADFDHGTCFRWRANRSGGTLHSATPPQDELRMLCGVEKQIALAERNTRAFLRGRPSNHMLLTGPRGCGKSSVVRGVLARFKTQLRIVETDAAGLSELAYLSPALSQRREKFVVYCDDLSFARGDAAAFQKLKSALDGGLSAAQNNIRVYATSNRRRMVAEYYSDNAAQFNDEMYGGETTEEKIALSDRFGLWLPFYEIAAAEYDRIVAAWLKEFGVRASPKVLARATMGGRTRLNERQNGAPFRRRRRRKNRFHLSARIFFRPMRKSNSVVTRAVAGIIRRPQDGAVFMQQRHAPQSFAGCWEFPGGKVNPRETIRDALRRELQEEVGIVAREINHFVRRQHRHAGGEVLLDFFNVESHDGTPRGCEGQNFCWAMPNAIPAPQLPANAAICKWLRLPPLCAITAAEIFGEKEMLRQLESALRARQIQFVQIRDKTLSPQKRMQFAIRAAALCDEHNALFCINDDADLAAKTGGGLHLSARRLAECNDRPQFEWVGASCHSAADIARAAELKLDFALLSPVQKTQSHPDAASLGWRRFAEIAESSGAPIYALGGMRAADLQIARRHNAFGIAMMRAAWQ